MADTAGNIATKLSVSLTRKDLEAGVGTNLDRDQNRTPPHTHNNAAVIATVIKGRVLNQMIHPKDEEGEAGACSLNGSGEQPVRKHQT